MIRRIFRRLKRFTGLGQSVRAKGPESGVLRAHYETRPPSSQTIADIFQNTWKSRLPNVEISGNIEMFRDPRVIWLAGALPGGLAGKTVCEIGPFEGYQTLGRSQQGVAAIT